MCFAQSPQSWQTSVGLPFLQITGTVRLEGGSYTVEQGPELTFVAG